MRVIIRATACCEYVQPVITNAGRVRLLTQVGELAAAAAASTSTSGDSVAATFSR